MNQRNTIRALVAIAIGIAASAGFAAAAPERTDAFAPAPAIGESFDVGTLHVDRYGTAKPAMILIPGLGSGPWSWYGTIAHFQADYTIYALTLPGFDGRPATTKTPLFATFVDDFKALLDQRKVDKPIVIGHSLGGTLAILLAEQIPSRLRAIVSVDGLPVFPTAALLSPQERTAAGAKAAAAIMNADPAAELAYAKNYMGTIGTANPALVSPAAALEAKSDPKAMAAWMQEDFSVDLRPELDKITSPVLEVMPYNAPDHGPSAPKYLQYTQAQSVAFYQSLLTGAAHADVIAIPDARHFAMLDQPQAFYAAVEKFIASLK